MTDFPRDARAAGWFNLSPRGTFKTMVVILTCIVAMVVLFPLLRTAQTTFFPDGMPSADAFRAAAGIRGFRTILSNTFWYVLLTVAAATAMGILLAWANERTDARMDRLAGILPILPLMVPPIGSALGYLMLFSERSGIGNLFLRWLFGLEGNTGPVAINTFTGMVFVTAISLVPIVYLIVSAALNNLDASLDEASRVFGGTPFRTARRITLPLVWPAITSAALLIAIHAVSSFSFPYIIGSGAGVTTLSVLIYRQFAIYPTNTEAAIGVAVLLLTIVYIGLYFQSRVARRGGVAMVGSKHSQPSRVRLGPWKWVVRGVMLAYLTAVFLPLIGLAIGSLQPYMGAGPDLFSLTNYRAVLANPHTRGALINSFSYGIAAACINMLVVTVLVYASLRMMKRGGGIIDYVLMLPSVIPHIVLAIAFIMAFGVPPFNLYGTAILVIAAYCVMFMPEAARAASAAVVQTNSELSEASHVFRAGPFRTFGRIVLPQIRRGVTAGWLVVFFLAVNEVTASTFLGGLHNPVVGHVAIEYFSTGRMSEVAAVALIVTVFTAAFVLLVASLLRERR